LSFRPSLSAALMAGDPKTFEAGLSQRTVVIEFDSIERAITCYESGEYQAAVKLLAGACERDLRILEGTS